MHVTVVVPQGHDPGVVADKALRAQRARPFRSSDFSLSGLVWDQFGDGDETNDFVTQNYNPANDPTSGGQAALLASQVTWTAVSTSTFAFDDDGGTTDRCPSLVKECDGPQSFDGHNDVAWLEIKDGNTLGVTWWGTSTDEADMALNTRFLWTADTGEGRIPGCKGPSRKCYVFDAQTVFLHENGHEVGLGHSAVDGAIMEPAYEGVRRILHQDDIDGISTLYPAGGGTPSDNPPSVTITNPGPGDTVLGTVSVTAAATDDDGIEQVEFFVDGASIGVDSGAPYEVSWDTTAVADGSRTVKAIATDTAHQTASDSVTVTVDNVADSTGGSYVWDIAFGERHRGPGGSFTDLLTTVTISVDSNDNGIAEASDDELGNATVAMTLTYAGGDGVFGSVDDDVFLLGGDTSEKGVIRFTLKFAPNGNYKAEVTAVQHATVTWDPLLDVENPDFHTIQ